MIFEIPNFVPPKELDFINSKVNSYMEEEEKDFEFKEQSYRDGKTILISDNEKYKELDNFLYKIFSSDTLQRFVNLRYKPAYGSGDSGYEFHRYGPGDTCHLHIDGEIIILNNEQFKNTKEFLIRYASVVLHLNTPNSGGELVFPEFNKTIKTEAGKIVIFPPYGFAQHCTTPSTDNRDVIVTWFVYNKVKAVASV